MTLERVADEIIQQIANGPSTALRYMKHNMNLAEKGNLNASLDYKALFRHCERHRRPSKCCKIICSKRKTSIYRKIISEYYKFYFYTIWYNMNYIN